MSFTVPWIGKTIDATATVVALLFVGRLPWLCGPFLLRECLRRDVVWWWFCSPDGAYDSVWDSVKPMTGKYTIYYFLYQEFVGCVCMLSFGFSSNYEICPDNYNYSRFKLKGKCRSVKWEVYLCGDMTIMVVLAQVQFLDRVTCPLLYDRAWVQTCRKLRSLRSCSTWGDGMTF